MDWYCWYPELYKADTMHLTAEQDGIYRRLIDHYMETRQPLQDNDNAISRAAGVDLQKWTVSSAIIRAFFKPDQKGFLRHKRCDIELDRQDARSRRKSESGKKGAEKRWNNYKQNQYADSTPISSAIADPMANDSIGQDKRGKKEKPSDEGKKKITLADLTIEHNRDWLEKKRAEGKYLQHDEAAVLEYFKNYCASTGKEYKDYLAAYRNSFGWENCQPKPNQKGQPHEQQRSKWDSAAEQILRDRQIRNDTQLLDHAFEGPEKLR